MRKTIAPFLLLVLAMSGCAGGDGDTDGQRPPPWVRTVVIESDGAASLRLSGTVRARYETPLAFQVGGRILERRVDAGQAVKAGQALFHLDPRDLDAAVAVAAAQLAAAEAAADTARRELERQRQLLEQGFVSRQALDIRELAVRDADSRRDAAAAQLAQARNARGYAVLAAEQDGLLIEVGGEPGQVVAQGQAVALLARAGARDIELFLPDGVAPPHTGLARLPDGSQAGIELREIAGAADPVSRTWRARYRLLDPDKAPALGAIVQVGLTGPEGAADLWRVPLGALDARSEGPRVWRIHEGRAEPVPVEVVALDAEQAHIRAPLDPGTRLIALGTHLLTPGMAVREQAR